MHRLFLPLCFLIGVCSFLAFQFLATNPYTPAGHKGYVLEKPRLIGKGGYRSTQRGPAYFGVSLRRNAVINVDVRPRVSREMVQIPTAVGIVKATVECSSVVEGVEIKALVERFGGEDWYEVTVRPLVRQALLSAMQRNLGPVFGVTSERLSQDVWSEVSHQLLESESPIRLRGLVVTTLELPQGIAPAPWLGDFKDALQESRPSGEGNVVISVGHQREFRGVWVASVYNIDWPSQQGLSVVAQKEELIAALDAMESMRMNALVLQVRPAGDALYHSEKEPWARWLTGIQGKAPEPFYDPLAFAIKECRKRAIEFHAWFNPFRAKVGKADVLAPNHIAEVLPQYAYEYGTQLWMDPGAAVVQEWILDVIQDVVKRYDLDGVHLDDYFYPYPVKGVAFPDEATYALYQKKGGKLGLEDWRRSNVDEMIRKIQERIQRTKPHVKFGVSPFGTYRNNQPEGVRSLDQYLELYADPKKWMEKGWVDYVSPQLYWSQESRNGFPKLLDWWTNNNPLLRHVYPGTALYHLNSDQKWEWPEIEGQITKTRSLFDRESKGNLFYGWQVFESDKGKDIRRKMQATYSTPALPPTMPWIDPTPPVPPQGLEVKEGKLYWNFGNTGLIRHWTLYEQGENSQWTLKKILQASATTCSVTAGKRYALCAVDRLHQESPGVVVEVQD